MALMPSPVFRWFVPISPSNTGLIPASGYKAKFFDAGTSNAKTIYTDYALQIPYASPTNTAVLDAEGKALIYLGAGTYKLQVTDPSDAVIYTQDNIQGDGNFGTGFVSSITALKLLSTTSNAFTYVTGYYASGDGGHGMFYKVTSSAADDGGYTIASTFDSTKRWLRIPDEDGNVRAASFGYIGATAGTQTTKLQAADAYAANNSAPLLIGPGNQAKIGPMTFSALVVDFNWQGSGGGLIGVTGSPSAIMFLGIVKGPKATIFTNVTVTMSAGQLSDHPEWFGAYTASTDNTPFMAAWITAGGGAFTLPPGIWNYATPATFPWPAGKFFSILGSLVGATTIGPGIRVPTVYMDNGKTIVSDGAADIAIVATTLETSAALEAGTSILSGTTIDAGTDSRAAGDIIAGYNNAAVTFLKARVGTAANVFKAGGNFYSNITPVSITADGNLMAVTIPIAGFFVDGDSVRITTYIKVTGAGPFNILLKNGSTTIWNSNGVGTGFVSGEFVFVRTSATTGVVYSNLAGVNTAVAELTGLTFGTTTTILQFSVLFNGNAGTVAQKQLNASFFPAA